MASAALTTAALWGIVCSQIVAQKPASQGVMTVHLSKEGHLRLWNQPIRPQDLPLLLERGAHPSSGASRLVVRLIPDPQVPWGVIHRMLSVLQPNPPQRSWTLQLQLP